MKIISVCILLIGLCGYGKENSLPRRSWQLEGEATKLYEVPVGNLFKLGSSPLYYLIDQTNKVHRRNCSCNWCQPLKITGSLQCPFVKKNELNKRMVVIDLTVRAFPALAPARTSGFSFNIGFSESVEAIENYRGFDRLIRFSVDAGYGAFFSSIYPVDYSTSMNNFGYIFLYAPFEPLALRIILDTQQGMTLVEFNGIRRNIGTINLETDKKLPVRNLCVFTTGDISKHRIQYLEFSPPTIRQFDSPEEVEKLSKRTLMPYPYHHYLALNKDKNKKEIKDLVRDALSSKNPDYQYAVALRLLYGEQKECDPGSAIKLLLDAAKDNHVLAWYQLGVCYYRGYGVVPDNARALKYLKDSASYMYQPADVLMWFIRWDMANRPTFAAADTVKEYIKIIEKYTKSDLENTNPTSAHKNLPHAQFVINIKVDPKTGEEEEEKIPDDKWSGPEYNIDFMSMISLVENSLYVAPPPKYAQFQNFVVRWIKKDSSKRPAYFIDYAIESGYYPAYAAKARRVHQMIKAGDKFKVVPFGNTVAEQEERIGLFRAGVNAGDTSAVPELLLALARRNKLTASEFTPMLDIQLAHSPLYQLMAFAVKNPDFPGLQEYINRNGYGYTKAAAKLMLQTKSPESEYLTGLICLAPMASPQRLLKMFVRKSEDMAQAFTRIINAAKRNVVPAQYLAGHYCHYENLPPGIGPGQIDARKMLESAAGAGHVKAAYLMAEIELKSQRFDIALKYLSKPCEAEYAPAFYLQGVIYQKMGRKEKESKQAFQKAAELGDHRGYRELALYSERSAIGGYKSVVPKSSQLSAQDNKYWFEFIQADLKYRTYDTQDPYYPNIYAEFDKWECVINPGGEGETSREQAELRLQGLPTSNAEKRSDRYLRINQDKPKSKVKGFNKDEILLK